MKINQVWILIIALIIIMATPAGAVQMQMQTTTNENVSNDSFDKIETKFNQKNNIIVNKDVNGSHVTKILNNRYMTSNKTVGGNYGDELSESSFKKLIDSAKNAELSIKESYKEVKESQKNTADNLNVLKSLNGEAHIHEIGAKEAFDNYKNTHGSIISENNLDEYSKLENNYYDALEDYKAANDNFDKAKSVKTFLDKKAIAYENCLGALNELISSNPKTAKSCLHKYQESAKVLSDLNENVPNIEFSETEEEQNNSSESNSIISEEEMDSQTNGLVNTNSQVKSKSASTLQSDNHNSNLNGQSTNPILSNEDLSRTPEPGNDTNITNTTLYENDAKKMVDEIKDKRIKAEYLSGINVDNVRVDDIVQLIIDGEIRYAQVKEIGTIDGVSFIKTVKSMDDSGKHWTMRKFLEIFTGNIIRTPHLDTSDALISIKEKQMKDWNKEYKDWKTENNKFKDEKTQAELDFRTGIIISIFPPVASITAGTIALGIAGAIPTFTAVKAAAGAGVIFGLTPAGCVVVSLIAVAIVLAVVAITVFIIAGKMCVDAYFKSKEADEQIAISNEKEPSNSPEEYWK